MDLSILRSSLTDIFIEAAYEFIHEIGEREGVSVRDAGYYAIDSLRIEKVSPLLFSSLYFSDGLVP
jgi:hypothetical protein